MYYICLGILMFIWYYVLHLLKKCVSEIARLLELVVCLILMHSSSWICTKGSGIKHAQPDRQTDALRNTTSTWRVWGLTLALPPATCILITTSCRSFHPTYSRTFLRSGRLCVWMRVRLCLRAYVFVMVCGFNHRPRTENIFSEGICLLFLLIIYIQVCVSIIHFLI